jgi:hypothetical protein
MRTTVSIDDALYRSLKARAGATGRTVSELVEDAIRDALVVRESSVERPELPVSVRRGGTMPGVDLYDNAALLAIMDERP